MKKNIKDIFDNYLDETVDIRTSGTISPDRIIALTKNKIMEDNQMNNTKSKKKWSMPIVAAALIAAISCTAFAAYYALSPKDIATRFEKYELAERFTKEDTVFDIPAQTSGGYEIALLGMTSGKNLDTVTDADTDKTYLVGAITKTDGTEITDYTNIMITPLVWGYKPWQVNIFTIGGGGKSNFLYKGAEYFLVECDNINIFADRTVYIAAYEGMAPGAETFTIGEDGSIAFCESYKGVKALFEVPLDKSKADPQAVQDLLKELGISAEDMDLSPEISAKDASEEDNANLQAWIIKD